MNAAGLSQKSQMAKLAQILHLWPDLHLRHFLIFWEEVFHSPGISSKHADGMSKLPDVRFLSYCTYTAICTASLWNCFLWRRQPFALWPSALLQQQFALLGYPATQDQSPVTEGLYCASPKPPSQLHSSPSWNQFQCTLLCGEALMYFGEYQRGNILNNST